MFSVVKSIVVKLSGDKNLYKDLKRVLGKYPNDIELYKIALTQRSDATINKNNRCRNNERLEYLGDAVISTIVAQHLFTIFPDKQEGFLTKMRAKIVSRNSLNTISKESGISRIVTQQVKRGLEAKHAPGDILEAIHGAMLLDFGYEKTKNIFIDKFLKFVDIQKLVEEEVDYKSRVLEWGQKNKRHLVFECFEEGTSQDADHFRVILFDGDVKLGEGVGVSKKEAAQLAAKQALLSGKIS